MFRFPELVTLPCVGGGIESPLWRLFSHRRKQFAAEKIAFAPNAFEPQQVLLRVAALTRFGFFFQRERFRVKQANRVFVRVIAGLRKLGNELVLLTPVYAKPILPKNSFFADLLIVGTLCRMTYSVHFMMRQRFLCAGTKKGFSGGRSCIRFNGAFSKHFNSTALELWKYLQPTKNSSTG